MFDDEYRRWKQEESDSYGEYLAEREARTELMADE